MNTRKKHVDVNVYICITHDKMKWPTFVNAVPASLLDSVLDVSTVVWCKVHQSIVGEAKGIHHVGHFSWEHKAQR